MSNALAKPGQQANTVMAEVSRSLDANKATIFALLPKEITPDKLKALTLTSLRKTPQLLRCDPQTIIACVYEAAKLGLQPDTATADCHIIPRKGEATFQIGFRGLMKLVRRAAPGLPIKAEEVREVDHFRWEEGLHPVLEHRRAPAGKDRTNSPITHAYAIARFPGGVAEFKVVDADDIARAKKSAHMTSYSPWQHHEGAMWCKTAVKRLCKMLPMDDPVASERVHKVLELDAALEDDRAQDLGGDFMLEGEGDTIDVPAHEYTCPACGTNDDESHAVGCPDILDRGAPRVT